MADCTDEPFMSVFDTLAELRYEQWIEETRAADYRPAAARTTTTKRQSYEGYLFSEVLRELDKAHAVSAFGKRQEHLSRAGKLEFQLMLLLEARNMPLAAATLRSSIAARRRQLCEPLEISQ